MPARRLLPALALLPALLLSAAAGDAAAKPARQRWQVVAVSIRGTVANSSTSGSPSYVYRGEAAYSGRGALATWDLTPEPGRLAPLKIGAGVRYSGSSSASITEESGRRWACSTPTPEGWAPRGIAVTAFFGARELRLNWSLVWPAIRCEDDAPPPLLPTMPADLGEQRYRLAPLKKVRPGKTSGFLIRIRESWADESGTASAEWTGKVVMKRLR